MTSEGHTPPNRATGRGVSQPESSALEFTVLQRVSGWRAVDWGELWRYRDLLYFLVWRDVKGRYAQTVLGIGWAVIQPAMSMVVFTVIFGNLAKISSDDVPYAIFSYTGLVPWFYFSTAFSGAGSSMVGAVGMISKVYFPRLVVPLSFVLAKLIDFVIAFALVFALMAWFRVTPTVWIVMIPVLVLIMMIAAAGMGMWVTASAVHYRDVRHALPYFVQLLMFASPVVYPASLIPSQYRLIYALNPMAGVIEGFRSALLGTRPMPWDMLAVGAAVAVALGVSGAFYFRRRERIFADVV